MATKKTTKAEQAAESIITIPAIDKDWLELDLVGDSPLVVHALGQKVKDDLRRRQSKEPKKAKGVRDPEAEYNHARYLLKDGRDGFPTVTIKYAIVDACSFVSGITKVEARGSFYVNPGEALVAIEHDLPTPIMREDIVRVGGRAGRGSGAADLRYRPEYSNWRIPIRLLYDRSIISAAQIVNLLNRAGFHLGIGEWRPQKGGQWGMFSVEASAKVKAA